MPVRPAVWRGDRDSPLITVRSGTPRARSPAPAHGGFQDRMRLVFGWLGDLGGCCDASGLHTCRYPVHIPRGKASATSPLPAVRRRCSSLLISWRRSARMPSRPRRPRPATAKSSACQLGVPKVCISCPDHVHETAPEERLRSKGLVMPRSPTQLPTALLGVPSDGYMPTRSTRSPTGPTVQSGSTPSAGAASMMSGGSGMVRPKPTCAGIMEMMNVTARVTGAEQSRPRRLRRIVVLGDQPRPELPASRPGLAAS